MALIKCIECGREVSTLASACPHCGAPVSYSVAKSKKESSEDSSRDYSGLITKWSILFIVVVVGYLFIRPHILPVEQKVVNWIKKIRYQEPTFSSSSPGSLSRHHPEQSNKNPATSTADPVMRLFQKTEAPQKDVSSANPLSSNAINPEESTKGSLSADNSSSKMPEPLPGVSKIQSEISSISIPNDGSSSSKEQTLVTQENPTSLPSPFPIPSPSFSNSSPSRSENSIPQLQPKENSESPLKKDISSPNLQVEDPYQQKLQKISLWIEEKKIPVVQQLEIVKPSKLVVIINENWTLFSCTQKKEFAEKIFSLWEEMGGEDLIFQTSKGKLVGGLNQTALKLRKQIVFYFTDCE